MSRLAALAALASLASLVSAQPEVVRDPGSWCTLYATPDGAVSGPPFDLGASLDGSRLERTTTRVITRRATTISVDYTGFTPQAQAAFQRAVDIWAAHLESPIEIRIQADFQPLGTDVLGQAGPLIIRDFGAGIPDTWYPFALADAIVGEDLSSEEGDFFYDISATFSSAFPRFYFGLDGRPAQNQIDFVTVVLHELGHGLGFSGSGDVLDSDESSRCSGSIGTGCWGFSASGRVSPVIFDRFIEDSAGNAFLDEDVYPNPSLALGDLLESEDLFADGDATVSVYGERPPIWAPLEFDRGSSFSHWDEIVIVGSSAALMTPLVANGEAYQDPGDITCAFFFDMGWGLGQGCLSLASTPPPPPPPPPVARVEVLTIDPAGPNPFVVSTAFRIRAPGDGPLIVALYDVLGREVARPFQGTAGADQTVRIPAAGLAAGVYMVGIRYGEERYERMLTVVR